MLKAMADNSIEIATSEDAAMYDSILGGENYIIPDIGNELTVTTAEDSFVVSLGTGGCVIRGRHVYESLNYGEASSITLEASSNGYIVIRYDLSNATGKEATFMAVPLVIQENINSNGSVCDLVLGKYVTDENGVKTYTDMRNIGIRNQYTVSITTSGFTKNSTSGYYEKTISNTNSHEYTKAPIYGLKYTGTTLTAREAEDEAFALITLSFDEGQILVQATETPTTAISVLVNVM